MKRGRSDSANGALRRCWTYASVLAFLAVQVTAAPLAAEGVVALQTAAPSCRDDSGAWYVDCGNGTVTDSRSGLVWLKDADCLGADVDWRTAMGFVAGLADQPEGSIAADDDCGLSDGSSPGDWRLPSRLEWWAMVNGVVDGTLNCIPVLTNDQGDACWSAGCPGSECSFSNVHTGHYWAADTLWQTWVFEVADAAGVIDTEDGELLGDLKLLGAARLWPVRGGQ